jgi:hypothetical protein
MKQLFSPAEAQKHKKAIHLTVKLFANRFDVTRKDIQKGGRADKGSRAPLAKKALAFVLIDRLGLSPTLVLGEVFPGRKNTGGMHALLEAARKQIAIDIPFRAVVEFVDTAVKKKMKIAPRNKTFPDARFDFIPAVSSSDSGGNVGDNEGFTESLPSASTLPAMPQDSGEEAATGLSKTKPSGHSRNADNPSTRGLIMYTLVKMGAGPDVVATAFGMTLGSVYGALGYVWYGLESESSAEQIDAAIQEVKKVSFK